MQEVEAKFEKFGAVKEARIVRNPVNGESRGFGFVAMKYEEDVDVVGKHPCHRPQACPIRFMQLQCKHARGVCHPQITLCEAVWALHAGHQDTGWCRVAGQAPWS